jgi:diguanylate cyclase (GGDEF)-like protein
MSIIATPLMHRVRVWMLAALLLAVIPAWGAVTSPLRFRHLATPSNPHVLSLLQDRQGFVWVGTQSGGLFRYDGYQAVRYTYEAKNERSLPAIRVAVLHQDSAGRIWAGTRNGLARYNPVTDDFTRFTPPAGPARQLDIKAIISDGAKGMWLATWGGVQHFDPDTGRFVQYFNRKDDPGSLARDDVNAIAVDARGGLWAATWPGGLDYLPPGSKQFQHFRVDSPEAPDAKANNVRALQFDSQQTLWIGTEGGALTWQDGRPWSERRRISAPDSRINVFYPGPDGAMWGGTISAGLLRWPKGSTTPVQHVYRPNDPYSLPADNVRAIMIDRSGMLWAGTFIDGIGVANLAVTGFERIIPYDVAENNPRPDNMLRSIEGAPGGHLWLAGTSGFALFDPANGEVLKLYRAKPKQPGALQSDLVYSIYQQPDGPLWVGTVGGLHRLDHPDGKFKLIDLGSGGNSSINSVSPGSGDWLWIGTGTSVMHYNSRTGEVKRYANDPANPYSRSVNGGSAILQDKAGRVWMGSEQAGGGLDLLDQSTGKFRHFVHSDSDPASLADNVVTTLHEDNAGRIWVGTEKGLNQVVVDAAGSVTFRSFNGPDSIGETRILAIRHDKAGNIWVSAVGGLMRLDATTGERSKFIDEDGISDAFAVASSFAAPDGTLYFGGTRGMTAVKPGVVSSRTTPPQVAITDISVFNRSLKDGAASSGIQLDGAVTSPKSLTLSVQQSVFSFEFAALHFTQPSRNRYAYMLQGFDRDWVQTDATRRTATYTNLDPGDYVFNVKASNDRGVWTEQPATVVVTILPPFYKTWWFRTLAILLTLGLLTLAYHVRVQRLTRLQSELESQVAARTAELEASNLKLAELMTTDSLTGILNRRGFDTALAREWARAKREGQPLGLAMIDVDHFKLYNDHYGHQEGDACLQAVARTIAAHAKRTTDVAARYGGEEFVVLLPGADGHQCHLLAKEICSAMQDLALPHQGSSEGVVTVSIGIASMVPDEQNGAETLVRHADDALYQAKQQGRNRAVLYSDATRPAVHLA